MIREMWQAQQWIESHQPRYYVPVPGAPEVITKPMTEKEAAEFEYHQGLISVIGVLLKEIEKLKKENELADMQAKASVSGAALREVKEI